MQPRPARPLKAAALCLFFVLAVGFSLSASIARSSGYVAGKLASAESGNKAAKLADEAYAAAKKSVQAECSRRGNKCRDMEKKADQARAALMTAKPVQSADPGRSAWRPWSASMRRRCSSMFRCSCHLGWSSADSSSCRSAWRQQPPRRYRQVRDCGLPRREHDRAAGNCNANHRKGRRHARKGRHKAYYLQRLEREHPAFAAKIASGEISVYAASIAGLRKAPTKTPQWTRAEAYA